MRKYNYGRLLGRIKEKGMTQEELAGKIERNCATFSRKINNFGCFTQVEISNICDVLQIADAEIPDYFFVH